MQNGDAENLGARLAQHIARVIFSLTGVVFLGLWLASIASTSVLDPAQYAQEHILFRPDDVPLNLLILALVATAVRSGGPRFRQLAARVDPPLAAGVMLSLVAAAGLLWVVAVQSVPAADSGWVASAARGAIGGDFSLLAAEGSYFSLFPFQLGYVLIQEGLMRLVGPESYTALGVVNVLWLVAAYAAVIKITSAVFCDRAVTLAVVVLLGLCWQPIFFTPFLYGNLLGLAAALWASYLALRFTETGRPLYLVGVIALCGVAVLAKVNYLVVAGAISAILLLDALRSRRWVAVLAAVALVAVCALLPGGVQRLYELRSGVALGPGTPQSVWLAMGLQEGPSAPGWYNGYTTTRLLRARYDADAAGSQSWQDIAGRLAELRADPAHAVTFFARKILSQWNETTFESIWVSAVKEHTRPPPAAVRSIYDGRPGALLVAYMDQYTSIVYLAVCLGVGWVLAGKRRRDGALLFPLIVLGAFAYHGLFEAKSQYLLVYLPLLLPLAAFAVVRFASFSPDWLGRMR